jgi:hypothetical protein
MRWTGNVESMGEKRNAYKILLRKPEGSGHYEDLEVSERIILKWMLEKQDGVVWTGSIWLRIGISGGLL